MKLQQQQQGGQGKLAFLSQGYRVGDIFICWCKKGTDDDFPPTHQNRIPWGGGGGRLAANGRSAVGSIPYPRVFGEIDMEAQIHQLEQEAYSSVLRAFKAQADAITWEKESLITELRKEMRLSNEEHRELLGRVNADDMIQRIRSDKVMKQVSGVKKIFDIIGFVYQYLKLLRELSPQEWIFKELRDIGNMEFRFAEEQPQDDYAAELTENLHFYPSEHIIYGDYV